MSDLTGLTPEQGPIVTTLDRPLFVAAGAGSGKTATLTRRIAWALEEGSGAAGAPFLDSLDQVLVITFTAAAASEIRERVRSRLRADGLVVAALAVDSAWIGTIHGMCSRILHRHALELGLDPDFVVAGEQDARVMREQAVEQVFSEVRDDPAFSALFAAYSARGRSMGGGDSASTVFGMVSTIVDKACTAPGGLGSLHFVGEAPDVTHEMSRLLVAYETLLGEATPSPKNAEALAACHASRDALAGFLTSPPSGRTPDAAVTLLEGSVTRPSGTFFRKQGAKDCRSVFDDVSAGLALAEVSELSGDLVELARRVGSVYDARKHDVAMLDNDDLLRLGLAALRDHPDIAESYSERFRLVMVDEFQDTSAQQVELVKLLSGGGVRLATVGDAQQSIYRFRGADVEVFRRRQAEAGDDVAHLTMNFRSHDDVLRFVAATCGGAGPAGGAPLLPDFMDLAAAPERRHALRMAGPRAFVELTSTTKVRVGRSSSAPSTDLRVAVEAAQVADRLASLVTEATDESDAIRPGDMALLLGRLKNAQVFIDALRARGLDCVMTGGSTFSATPEVQTVAALLHALANPKDTRSGLFPLLSSDMFRLDANDFCTLGTTVQETLDAPTKRTIDRGLAGDSFLEGLPPSPRLAVARDVLPRAWERLGAEPVADVMLAAIRESGWLARLEAEGVEGRAVAANVLAAVRYVRDLTEDAGLGASRAAEEFDRWLEVAKVGPASLRGGASSAVSIMTVHGSKGLEFPVVAVAECTQARQQVAPDLVASDLADATALSLKPDGMSFPKDVEVPIEASECHTFLDWRSFLEAHERSGEDAEKARLLYVALTRAREAVVLSVDCPLSAQGSLPDRALASSVVRALLGGTLPEPGCSGLAFGGGTDGVVRRVDLTLADDPACVHVSSDGSMPAFDGDLPADVSSLVVAGVAGDSATASQPFMLFSPERDDLPSVGTWSAHDGILSYSGSHTREGTAAADALSYASATVSPFDEADQPHPDTTPAEVERATNLGTAFHEAARLLIETGQAPSAGRLDVLCRADGVLRTQRPRLEEALARWQASPTRAELLACAHVGAEVPFCVPVTSERGSLLEGAIDALGTDDAHGAALVVDYKTGDAGLSPAELTQAHQMQARYYAHVLKGQGYARVSCAFVCVELVAVDGGPVVVRYEWPDGCDAEL